MKRIKITKKINFKNIIVEKKKKIIKLKIIQLYGKIKRIRCYLILVGNSIELIITIKG